MLTNILATIGFRLKEPQTFGGWIVLIFGIFWQFLGAIQNVEYLAQKWPRSWAVPNPNWAWLPLLFGVAWLTVAVALPDKKLPALRRFAPQMREHPKSPGMIFMVIPIRNDSLTTELLQVSAFLWFKRGLYGQTIYIHDALWFEWYPEYGDRQIRRNETRHVVIAVGWSKDGSVKDQPPLAVGFEHELKKPEPKSLRERLQRARWTLPKAVCILRCIVFPNPPVQIDRGSY